MAIETTTSYASEAPKTLKEIAQEKVASAAASGTKSHYRTAPLPLNITIVGAGMGGLAVAHVLGASGHKVTILENAPALTEVGAGIQLTPNATRLLLRWGLGDKLKEIANIPSSLVLRTYKQGEIVGWRKVGDTFENEHGAPYYHVHRADLHRLLVEIAEPLINIRLGCRVVDVDTAAGSVTLASGEVVTSDLVIGADGLNSRTRDAVVGAKDTPRPTGDAVYRATIQASALLADPELKVLIEDPATTVWMGPKRHIVGYCTRRSKLYNLVMCHPARDGNETIRETSKEQMMADYAEFDPKLRKLINVVDDPMVWALMDRDPLDTWISNKVVLLGDACHPMTPHRAQGAAMAIEDGAVLGNLLSRISDIKQLPALLKAYEKLRFTRATQTQIDSRTSKKIFHYADGPEQEARDASMRVAMAAALKEAAGEAPEGDNVGSQNLWADKERNKAAFDYDADEEAESWVAENWSTVVEKSS